MLSRMRIIDLSARNDRTADDAGRSGPSKIPIPCAIAARTCSGSSIVARLTNHAPSWNSGLEHASGLDRQARLADAARAGQRHQPRVLDERHEIGEVTVTAHE